jgi:hypothetical protein
MPTLSTVRAAFAGSLVVAAGCAQAQLSSSFDGGLEGWTAAGGTISYVASGGSPGGYLKQVDTLGTFMTVIAPSAFHGDLSSFLGGVLSFDARNLSGSASDLPSPGPWFGTVTIAGGGGSFASALLAGSGGGQPPADGAWHGYSIFLTPGAWSGDLASVLGNVSNITVQLEFNNAIVETAGFDNFKVSAVPEESTLVLLAAGLVSMVSLQRRRQRRRSA